MTLPIALLLAYLLMAQWIFKTWLKFFEQDTSMSSENRRLSWVILLVGTILWPVVVPIAYIKLLEEKFNRQYVSEEDEEIEKATQADCEPTGRCSKQVTAACWN